MHAKSSTNGVNEPGKAGIVYEFGIYRLSPSENLLLRSDEKLHLKPKAIEMLVFLVERNNRVVGKAEIIDGVWSDSFVEEANLAVHVSALRKIFSGDEDQVSIETLPRLGYRLKISGEVRKISVPDSELRMVGISDRGDAETPIEPRTRSWFSNVRLKFSIGLVTGILAACVVFYWLEGFPVRVNQALGFDYVKTKRFQTFKTLSCSRETSKSNLENGGCEEAVASFSLAANPNGNWSYGFTPRLDHSSFILFEHAVRNNHFSSPEIPSDIWSRDGEWHPLIIRNTSPLTILIQEGVILPPNMFEMHPGPNGERSVLRWTAPANGHFRMQGQFRGLNTNGQTSTDALIVHNTRETRFSEDIDGFNIEKPFDLTFKVSRGDTIDFSVGFGVNQNYECDSTGFSLIITTISIENNGH